MPEAVLLALAPLALGLALDAAYPFHSGPLLSIHPVHTSYVMATRLARALRGRAGGVLLWAAVVGSHLAAYGAALWAAWRLGPLAWILVASYVVKVSMPVRLLADHVSRAGRALAEGDLEGARRAAQGIVRRDLSRAGPGHVASAALESLFESLVDGITSPLFYYVLLGPLGALLQRLANTMDGAVGFTDPPFRDIGWFSAVADTALNYLPARITSMLEVVACWILGREAGRALSCYRRCRRATASLNAGHPMSAAAGCLGVRLEKEGSYSLGEGGLPGPDEIRDGLRLAALTLSLGLAAAAAITALCAAVGGCPWIA